MKKLPIRVYDNGGKSIDRYTVVFTKVEQVTYRDGSKSAPFYMYLALSSMPFHPQGFAQHGEIPILPSHSSWIGVGKRIPFSKLPEDCKKVVLRDLEEEIQ